jgi:cathepsin B
MTKQEIKRMMGTVVDPEWTYKGKSVESSHFLQTVPATFDAREAWPACQSVIGHVRDQANCGSCWAHGTTEAFNDRLCIKTNGTFKTLLSTADTTGCCGFLSCFSMGCNGGQVGLPWGWFKSTGVVTGGDFGDKDTCYPYTMPFCAHHVTGTTYPDCSTISQVDPTCSKQCQNSLGYSSDKHKATSSYGLSSVDQIKADLVQYGSVTAAFTVYEDFVNYKSGVYRHTTGSALGGHAVKIIGYGEDHWIVVNSWNETWGDNGTFKIAFGECGIDS